MITDSRAYNEVCSKPEVPAFDAQAFINQRTRSAGGWIDSWWIDGGTEVYEPFNYPRIRKDDPRSDEEHDGVPRALTCSVGKICKYHRAYMTSRLILVAIVCYVQSTFLEY